MKMFKKLVGFCMALALTISLSSVVGCRNSSSSTYSSSSSSSSNSSEEETPLEEYTVRIIKPENVTIAGMLTVEGGSDVTFTATVDCSFVLSVTGATAVCDPTTEDGKTTYTYQVAEITADTTVTITATQIHLNGSFSETNNSITIPVNGSYTATLSNNIAQHYCVTWDNENVIVFVDSQELTNDCATAVVSGSSIVAFNASDEEITCSFRIVPYVDEIGVLVVGTNEYTINTETSNMSFIVVNFAVTVGQTYTFSVTNGRVLTYIAGYPEDEIVSYVANTTETIQLTVCPKGAGNVAITVVVTELATSP